MAPIFEQALQLLALNTKQVFPFLSQSLIYLLFSCFSELGKLKQTLKRKCCAWPCFLLLSENFLQPNQALQVSLGNITLSVDVLLKFSFLFFSFLFPTLALSLLIQLTFLSCPLCGRMETFPGFFQL